MSLVHRLIGGLLVAAVAVLALGVLALAVLPPPPGALDRWLGAYRGAAAVGGVVVLTLAAVYALTGERRRSRDVPLTVETSDGSIAISSRAVAGQVRELAGEFPDVTYMDARVLPTRRGVVVTVDVSLKAGPRLRETAAAVQKRVWQAVCNGLGISELRRVDVHVRALGPLVSPPVVSVNTGHEEVASNG